MAGAGPSFTIGQWLNETYRSNVADVKLLTKEHRQFYFTVPRRFIVNSLVRFALIELILAFFSFSYFLVAELPTFAFVCLRFHIFTKQMKTFNLSAKRLWIAFAAVYIVFFVLCRFLRKWLFGLIA